MALAAASAAWGQTPWSFAIMSDPQFGMYTHNKGFAQETVNFEFAIANANRLHPAFLVICGDLVNEHGNLKQIAEYKHILKQLNPAIKVYSVAGNHDVGNVPTSATIQAFHKNIGADYYTFSENNIYGIVLDSNLIRAPQEDPKAATKQMQWLIKTLHDAASDPGKLILVFQHIPYFVKSPDEKDAYFNIPKRARREYLDILERGGVRYVFAGHTHYPAVLRDGGLTEIITGAVGKPLRGSASGFRIVSVRGNTLQTSWFDFGRIPNRFELRTPSGTH